MNNQQQPIPQKEKDRHPVCNAKPQISLYVFLALVVIGFLIYRFIIKQ